MPLRASKVIMMSQPNHMPLFKQYQIKKGRGVCICTDLHGALTDLNDALKTFGFDNKSTLFLCGDSIDRSNESYFLLQHVRHNKNFFSVMGNHEYMFACGVQGDKWLEQTWLMNGGEWSYALSHDVLLDAAKWAETLPLAVEICLPDGKKVGIVHGEVPEGMHWNTVKSMLLNPQSHSKDEVENLKLSLLEGSVGIDTGSQHLIEGVDAIVSGHVRNDEPTVMGNRIYADTGAGMDLEINNLGITLLEYKEEGELLGLFDAYLFKRDGCGMMDFAERN